MNRDKFKRVFNCPDRTEVINRLLLQDPEKFSGFHQWQDPYGFTGFHCIYNRETLSKGSYCCIEYYMKATVNEVARVTYKREVLGGKEGAQVLLGGIPCGWIAKDLSTYAYIPEQIFACGVMSEIFEVMLRMRRDANNRETDYNSKVILEVKDELKKTEEELAKEKEANDILKQFAKENNCSIDVFAHPELFHQPSFPGDEEVF